MDRDIGKVVWSADGGWVRERDSAYVACRIRENGHWQHRRFGALDDAQRWVMAIGVDTPSTAVATHFEPPPPLTADDVARIDRESRDARAQADRATRGMERLRSLETEIDAAYARGRADERADVVAYLHRDANAHEPQIRTAQRDYSPQEAARILRIAAKTIEAGEHTEEP